MVALMGVLPASSHRKRRSAAAPPTLAAPMRTLPASWPALRLMQCRTAVTSPSSSPPGLNTAHPPSPSPTAMPFSPLAAPACSRPVTTRPPPTCSIAPSPESALVRQPLPMVRQPLRLLRQTLRVLSRPLPLKLRLPLCLSLNLLPLLLLGHPLRLKLSLLPPPLLTPPIAIHPRLLSAAARPLITRTGCPLLPVAARPPHTLAGRALLCRRQAHPPSCFQPRLLRLG